VRVARSRLGLTLVSLLLVVLLFSPTLAAVVPGSPMRTPSSAPLGTERLYAAPAALAARAVAPSSTPIASSRPTTDASSGSTGVHPATVTPGWSSDFAGDAVVTFSMPYGGGAMTNFTPEPAQNEIAEYATGFWMNLTTLKPLIYANVTIWGNQWPVNGVTKGIEQFTPQLPGVLPMNLSNPYTASFFFDDYRFFWPGSLVYFNVTLTALNASPSSVYSATTWGYPVPSQNGPIIDYASWIFNVQGPWVSPNFASSVNIVTTPNVFGNPATDPNPKQPLEVTLTAIAPPGLAVGTIPAATLNWSVRVGGIEDNYSESFFPLNATTVSLINPVQPAPNSQVFFNVTMWLPWEGGAIDFLYSPEFSFNWSTKGGWWYPNQGLLNNLVLTSSPEVLPPASGQIPAGTPVNLSLHEPIENVTISSAQVDFYFQQGLGKRLGSLPMVLINANTSSLLLPGLPPGGSLTFYLVAKDIYGDPVFSQNFTYSATGSTSAPIPPNHNLFFFEALDVAGTGLVPSMNFTLSNATWTESRVGTPLGFGAPLIANSSSYLDLAWGSYLLTVTAFGRSWTTTVVLADNSTPFTLVYYVASASISEGTTSSLPILPIAAAVGIVAVAAAAFFIMPWWNERRAKIEAEQRRVTL
jgi:hypothetical protein